MVWTLRIIAWAVLLVIGYRGVLAIVTGNSTTSSAPPASTGTPAAAFPSTLAEAYALQFGSVYLNFSPATAQSRAAGWPLWCPPAPPPSWAGMAPERRP